MEVHHHPNVEKKNFAAYFLEFLMIFLAVTMGFFAESLREHIADGSKEKDYMSSLIEELKYDTAQYNKAIYKIGLLKPPLDSAYQNLKRADSYGYLLQGKWNYAINNILPTYRPTLPTIQQLESSGNLRLIENKRILVKLIEYQTSVKDYLQQMNDKIESASARIWAFEDAYCDYGNFVRNNGIGEDVAVNTEAYSDFSMKILLRDSLKLNEFANSFVNYKNVGFYYVSAMNIAKKSAIDLIEIINEQYHFDKE